MDLRLYYQKIRDTEAKIAEAFPVIVSQETTGRRQGREVRRSHARGGGENDHRGDGAVGDGRGSEGLSR